MKRFVLKIAAGLLILGVPYFVLADTMSSSSFIITSDDISAGGGNSTSASYISESDIGGRATGEGLSSASFAACAGYPCTLEPAGGPSISFSVTPNSVALGTLTTGGVATGTTTFTTTSNASNGYVVTVVGDGQMRTAANKVIPDVADGAVTAGAGEYGIGLAGTDRAFTDDRSVTTTPRIAASNAGTVTNSSVTVTFKAAISGAVASGSYNQIATFICSGTF
jgi:hypothetical protein